MLEAGLSQVLREGLFQILSLVVSAVVLVALDPLLAVVVLLGAPLIAVGVPRDVDGRSQAQHRGPGAHRWRHQRHRRELPGPRGRACLRPRATRDRSVRPGIRSPVPFGGPPPALRRALLALGQHDRHPAPARGRGPRLMADHPR